MKERQPVRRCRSFFSSIFNRELEFLALARKDVIKNDHTDQCYENCP